MPNVKHVDMKFQFHNGSIKSSPQRSAQRSSPMFQFHNGSIKRGVSLYSIYVRLVSIPQWFD